MIPLTNVSRERSICLKPLPILSLTFLMYNILEDLKSPNIKQQVKQSWQSYSDLASDLAKQKFSRLFKGSATMPLLEIKCHC